MVGHRRQHRLILLSHLWQRWKIWFLERLIFRNSFRMVLKVFYVLAKFLFLFGLRLVLVESLLLGFSFSGQLILVRFWHFSRFSSQPKPEVHSGCALLLYLNSLHAFFPWSPLSSNYCFLSRRTRLLLFNHPFQLTTHTSEHLRKLIRIFYQYLTNSVLGDLHKMLILLLWNRYKVWIIMLHLRKMTHISTASSLFKLLPRLLKSLIKTSLFIVSLA